MKYFLIISHGSHYPKTKKEIKELVEKLRERITFGIVEYAFLEIESPSIPEAIDLCAQRGANEIVLILNFLNSGKHVDGDILLIINDARKKYSNINFKISKPVGQHPSIADIFFELME